MSLAFLGLDDDLGKCPTCSGHEALIYTSYSSQPVGCEGCLYLRKANGENVSYLEGLIKQNDEAYIRRQKVLKELALELGRKRLERMKQA